MLRATFRSLLAHKLRLAMSGLAIVLGVAFVAGSLIFTDTLGRSFEDIFRDTAPDVTVRPAGADAAADGGFTAGDARAVPAGLVRTLEQVPGVARVDGNVVDQGTFVVGKDGKVVGGQGAPGIAQNWNDAPSASGEQVVTLASGHEPRGPTEVVLDVKTAAAAGYVLGDTVKLVSSSAGQATSTATLVGTLRFGDTGNLVGASITALDTATAQRRYLGNTDSFSDLAVTAADGVSPDQLATAVSAALPAALEARTAAQVSDENASALQQGLGFISTFLLVFAVVALIVGVFLIVNTFSIIVAQRTRELALLRALGASRRQVTRSVLVEALAVALVGSTLGLLLGFGLAEALKALFGAFGLDLGSAGLVLSPATVAWSYAVGLVVTMLAAYLPARRASHVPPVAAMRDDVALPEASLRRRLVGGVLLTVAGAAGMVATLWGPADVLVLGLGVVGVLVGVALLSPVIGRPVVGAIGASYPRLFGAVGRLARENARRNPRRTAATASALMIGLALVSTMAVLGQSAKASVDADVASDLDADYVVSNAIQQPFSPAVARDVRAVAGVERVVPVRFASAKLGGERTFVAGSDGAGLQRTISLRGADGSLAGPGGSQVLLASDLAAQRGWGVGDDVTLGLPGGPQRLSVTGTYEPSPLMPASAVVAPATLERGGLRPADSTLYVLRSPGASSTQVAAGLDRALADLPTVTVKDQAAYADEQRAPVDQLLAIVYALLALAVVIAVLGIVNTLALSVIERTREIGLLRAVGVSRRQLRRMVRLESVAISVLGAVLGVVLGIVFGVSLVRALSDQGLSVLAVPGGQLVAFVVAAGVVGVLAAVLPARRAARLDVLQAISTE